MADGVAARDSSREGNQTNSTEARSGPLSASLDVLPVVAAGRQPRISPTVISQFVRLDQCRRFLRLALHERAYGSGFMREYYVAPQEILPLLTRAGAAFEARVEDASARRFSTRKLAPATDRGERQPDNEAMAAAWLKP